MIVEPGLCGAWSETPKTGFLNEAQIIFYRYNKVAVPNLNYCVFSKFADRKAEQTVEIKIRLLLEEQPGQGLHFYLSLVLRKPVFGVSN